MTSTVPTDEPVLTGVSFGALNYTLVLHYDRDLPRDWAQTVRGVLATPPASAKNETGIDPIKTWTADCYSGRYTGMIEHPAGAFVLLSDHATHLAEITRQRDEALAKVAELERDLSNARWEEHHQWKRAEALQTEGSASCPTCNGTGHQGGNPDFGQCDDCGGSGVLFAISPQAPGVEVTEEMVNRGYDAAKRAMPGEALREIGAGELERVVIATLKAALPSFHRVEASDAALDVLAERRRQIEQEGWTPEHDDRHDKRELAYAASAYLGPVWMDRRPDGEFVISSQPLAHFPPLQWVWDREWWKPGGDTLDDYRRRLVKGTALGLAEIERIDRQAALGSGEEK